MQAVKEYLKKIGFVQSWDEMKQTEENFVAHMQAGLEGKPGTIPMIPAYVSAETVLESEKDVIVMDAGGTNLRVALLHMIPGCKPEILSMSKQPMPGTQGELDVEDFFDELAKAVLPVAEKSDRIGFCFSFPCEIQPDYDGKIIHLDKEVTVRNCEGRMVAQGLRQSLKRLGVKQEHKIVVLNDTVTALLGALAENPVSCFSNTIGCILGTGMNCCYSEKNTRIVKNSFLNTLSGSSIINMEAGGFGAKGSLHLTPADEFVRSISLQKDVNLLEKMISGAYQNKVLYGLLLSASQEGLFTPDIAGKIQAGEIPFDTKDISSYLLMPRKDGLLHSIAPDGEDAQTLFALTDAVIERAAMMAVMSMVSIMRFTSSGTDPLLPVCIAIEGTTFEKNYVFHHRIFSHLENYAQKERGFHTRVFSTENANLVGSGMAAVSL